MMLVMDDVMDVEVGPRTQSCSVQAALYRVGEPAEPLLPATPDGGWSPALQGMLIKKPLPPVYSVPAKGFAPRAEWRRWLGAVCLEEPQDSRRELHERPAFLRFCHLTYLFPGGGAVDHLSELGDERDQVVALTYLLGRGPRWVAKRDLPREEDDLGAIFVGEAAPTARRGGARALLRDLQHRVRSQDLEHRVDLLRAAANVTATMAGGTVQASAERVDVRVRSHLPVHQSMARGRGQDLSYGAACELARWMRFHGYRVAATAEALNLGGYLNKADSRSWYPRNTKVAGGWDD